MAAYDRFLSDVFDSGEADDDLCIDVVPGGVMESIPATWDVRDGFARLRSFQIGALIGDRAMAVLMTGEAHVAEQEVAVSERWAETECERREARMADLRGDRWGDE